MDLMKKGLQLHEVVCHFKYYNADDIHFSKVVYINLHIFLQQTVKYRTHRRIANYNYAQRL